MDYKKIIKSQNLRFKILKFLSWIPDRTMIKIQYRIKTGRKLNLKNPKRFSEKLQWYKLNYRNPLMTICADKYKVREYLESKKLSYILNELYGVYDSVEEIEFEKLPNKFILKTTNGSKTNIICKDKEKLNIEQTKKVLNEYLNRKGKSAGREWAYDNIEPKIVCEKLLDMNSYGDLPDYKFFCFNGKVYFSYIIIDRFLPAGEKLGIFDLEGKQLPYYRCDVDKLSTKVKIPESYKEMIKIATKIAKDFPHVRVDFYDQNGKIVFGELTFYDGSGYMKYSPDSFDFDIGEKFEIEGIKWPK